MSTAFKMKYDEFIAMLISNAVKEIEKATGKQVALISFPTPTMYENKENTKAIHVEFVKPDNA